MLCFSKLFLDLNLDAAGSMTKEHGVSTYVPECLISSSNTAKRSDVEITNVLLGIPGVPPV